MAGVVCVEGEAERACPGQELRSQTGERLGGGPRDLLQEDRRHISLARDKPGKILLTSTAPMASSPVLSFFLKMYLFIFGCVGFSLLRAGFL